MTSVGLLVLYLVMALQFGVGFWLSFRHFRFLSKAHRVRGITLEPRAFPDDGGPEYTTRVEYFVNGERYVFSNKRGPSQSKRFHRAGRMVWVHYLPDQPGSPRLISWWESIVYFVPILLGIYIGFILLKTNAS